MSRVDDLRTQLTETEAAISKLITDGVSMYSTTAGGQVQRLNLADLRARASELRQQIARSSGRGFVAVRRGGL